MIVTGVLLAAGHKGAGAEQSRGLGEAGLLDREVVVAVGLV